MVVSTFFVLYKDDRERFFKKSFLLVNVKSDVILRILFLIMSSTDIDFQAQDLQ